LKRSSGPSPLGWALADKECGEELVLVSPVEGRVRREADFRSQRESLEGLGRREGRSPGLASSSSGSGRGILRDQLDLAAKNASLRIDLFDRELTADQFGFFASPARASQRIVETTSAARTQDEGTS
jgi:hypothetical protein